MSLFKNAYTRGCTQLLLDAGFIKCAEGEAAGLADEVGPRLNPEPQAGAMDPAATQELLEALLALAQEKGLLGAGPGAEAGGSPHMAPPPPKTAAETGSTITGDKPEQENHETQSANAEAKMDLKTRPEPYAAKGVAGVGKSDMPKEKGRVGEEELHAGKEPDKQASLSDIVRKMASSVPGSTISSDHGKHDNLPGKSPNAEAKLDLQNRAVGAHLTGMGKTELHTHPGEVGKEKKHEGAEAPKAHAVKSAAYVNLFELTATEILPKIPAGFNDEEKVACVKAAMGMEAAELEVFISKLAEESEKVKALVKDEEAHHGGKIPTVAEEHKEKEDDKKKGEKEEKAKEAAEKCEKCSEHPCKCEKEEPKSEKAKEEKKANVTDRRSALDILKAISALSR